MSGGGFLGQLYARRHPEALAGLILESVCPCFRERLADPACALSPLHAAWRAKLAEAGLLGSTTPTDAEGADATEWVEVPGVGSVFRRRNGPALLVAPMALLPEMRRAMPALWSFDARGWLQTVRVPTLVLCGTADPILPVTHARSLHEAIAGSEFVPVEGAGHVPVSERRPEVAAAVRRFLATRVAKPGLPFRQGPRDSA
jgi:pimeloyl-ACP methyl ester carboxylesterase